MLNHLTPGRRCGSHDGHVCAGQSRARDCACVWERYPRGEHGGAARVRSGQARCLTAGPHCLRTTTRCLRWQTSRASSRTAVAASPLIRARRASSAWGEADALAANPRQVHVGVPHDGRAAHPQRRVPPGVGPVPCVCAGPDGRARAWWAMAPWPLTRRAAQQARHRRLRHAARPVCAV